MFTVSSESQLFYNKSSATCFGPHREHSKSNKLLQLLCKNTSTRSHTLTKLRQFCCILEMEEGLKIVLCNCALPDDGTVRPVT